MSKKIDWIKKSPIAHRGLHNEKIPENSIAAFSKAIQYNLPIELDVQLTRDNEVVVFHDYELKRMTGVDGKVSDADYNQIKKLKLLNTSEQIPKLEDVLTLVQGEVPLLIEIKNKNSTKGIELAVCKVLKDYQGEFAIQSFNPLTIFWFKKNAPELIRGQLSCDFRDETMGVFKRNSLRFLIYNLLSDPDFIAYDIRAINSFWSRIIRTKYPLVLWTIRTNEEKLHAEKIADNYIFENMSIL